MSSNASNPCATGWKWYAEPDCSVKLCTNDERDERNQQNNGTKRKYKNQGRSEEKWNAQLILDGTTVMCSKLARLQSKRNRDVPLASALFNQLTSESIEIIIRSERKSINDQEQENEFFTLGVYFPGRERAVFCRHLPRILLQRAIDIQSRFRVACHNRKPGENDIPSASNLKLRSKTLANINSNSIQSIYTTCVRNDSLFNSVREGTLKMCPVDTPYFDGHSCRTESFNCKTLKSSFGNSHITRWRHNSMPLNEYMQCIDDKITRKQCRPGHFFDGVTCVNNLHRESCDGMSDGTFVADLNRSDRRSFRVCQGGIVSNDTYYCPPHKSIFSKGACVSMLCEDDVMSNFKQMRQKHNIAYDCINGEAIIPSHKMNEYDIESRNLRLLKRYLEWIVNSSASIAINTDGLIPLHWIPLWPHWATGNESLNSIISVNEGQLSLWHIGCINGNTAFSHASINTSRDKYDNLTLHFQQSDRNKFVYVATNQLTINQHQHNKTNVTTANQRYRFAVIIPLAYHDNQKIVNSQQSIHNAQLYGRNNTMYTFSDTILTLGDKRIVVEVTENELIRKATSTENKLLVPEYTPQSLKTRVILLGMPIPANPLLFVCNQRPWTCYYPTQDTIPTEANLDGNANSICIANSSAALAFNLRRPANKRFRTIQRNGHGFRTFSYSEKQTLTIEHQTSTAKSFTLIEVEQTTNVNSNKATIQRRVRNIQRAMHSFLPQAVNDFKCRNWFRFASKNFASFHNTREAYVSDNNGNILAKITCESLGQIMSYPFQAYKFIGNTEHNMHYNHDVHLHAENKCRIRISNLTDDSAKTLSVAVFGVDVFFNEKMFTDIDVFIPIGFAELSVIPTNIQLALPHLPMNVLVESNGLIKLSLIDDISSDTLIAEKFQCLSGGGFWDYEADACNETAENEITSTVSDMTEDVLKVLFSV